MNWHSGDTESSSGNENDRTERGRDQPGWRQQEKAAVPDENGGVESGSFAGGWRPDPKFTEQLNESKWGEEHLSGG
jgi:hypothetical protein